MKILLSIKPHYANKIFNKNKAYEYRRVIFKNKDIKKIIVYSSSPEQKVIGEFEIQEIISGCPKIIWEKTKHQSGITEDEFLSYSNNTKEIHAIKIKKAIRYKKPLSLIENFKVKFPPQSFVYL